MINTFGRFLILAGIILIIAGLVFTFAGKIPWLGRLPGDIYIKRDNDIKKKLVYLCMQF